ncbi:MAG TPA: FG-GAP-like repeat-containing protein, partial [Gemmatimonadales bacterium]|nr:FG-GAP-like repeat-containing protein [Gemmatimonadales bacterium]
MSTNPLTVSVADLNHDARLDLVVPANAAGTVMVFWGDGLGGFSAGPALGVGAFPEAAAVADLNADTHPDIAVVSFGTSDVSVLLGDGSGGFAAASGSPFATGTAPFAIAIADMNADTFPDLVVANAGSNNVSVLLGTGTGGFAAATNFSVGVNPRDVAVADLNNDGLRDIVATNYAFGAGTTASVLMGTGGGGFAAAVDYTTGPAPRTVALADLNGDANPDAVVANLDGGATSALAVLLGNGDGTFQTAVPYGGVAGGAAHGVAVGDFNVDGKVDVAVTNSNLTTITLYNGDGAGNLQPPGTFFTAGTNPFFVGVGDFDGDGRDDLAVSNFGSGNASVFLNTLTLSADLAIGKTGPTSVVAGLTVAYTTTVTNLGPNNAFAVSVADPTPSGLTFVSNTGACTTAFPCSLGTMTSGQVRTITSTFLVPSGYSGASPFDNTATVGSSTADPTPGNDSSTASTAVSYSADVSITKTDGVTSEVPGTGVTYTIAASNAGPSNAPSVTIADSFPGICAGATWSCVGAGGGSCTLSGVGDISDTASLPVGGSATYTASCTISASATGSLSNTATASVGGGVTDPTPANNSATDTDTLTAEADVSITKTDGVTSEVPGTGVTYTIVASNAGPSSAPSVTIADSFPGICTGATWSCAGAGGGSCTLSGLGDISDTASLPVG